MEALGEIHRTKSPEGKQGSSRNADKGKVRPLLRELEGAPDGTRKEPRQFILNSPSVFQFPGFQRGSIAILNGLHRVQERHFLFSRFRMDTHPPFASGYFREFKFIFRNPVFPISRAEG